MSLAVKVLGGIDLVSAIVFLMFIFGMRPFLQFILFCSGLLLIKGMFVLTGDVLSFVDLVSAVLLIISIFFMLPTFLLWTPAFLLLAKGFVSFL